GRVNEVCFVLPTRRPATVIDAPPRIQSLFVSPTFSLSELRTRFLGRIWLGTFNSEGRHNSLRSYSRFRRAPPRNRVGAAWSLRKRWKESGNRQKPSRIIGSAGQSTFLWQSQSSLVVGSGAGFVSCMRSVASTSKRCQITIPQAKHLQLNSRLIGARANKRTFRRLHHLAGNRKSGTVGVSCAGAVSSALSWSWNEGSYACERPLMTAIAENRKSRSSRRCP